MYRLDVFSEWQCYFLCYVYSCKDSATANGVFVTFPVRVGTALGHISHIL